MSNKAQNGQPTPDNDAYWAIDWECFMADLRAFVAEDAPIPGAEDSTPFFLVVVGHRYRILAYHVTPQDLALLQKAQAGDGQAALEVRRLQLAVLARIGVPYLSGMSFLEAWVMTVASQNDEVYEGKEPRLLVKALRSHEALRVFYGWLLEAGYRFE